MIAYLLACPWYFAFDASLDTSWHQFEDILSTLRFIPTSTRIIHGSSLINMACSLHRALRFDCKRACHGASEHARRIEIDFKIETIHLWIRSYLLPTNGSKWFGVRYYVFILLAPCHLPYVPLFRMCVLEWLQSIAMMNGDSISS